MAKTLTVRFRVDFGGQCSVGVGKIALLENIARAGSLSQAARDMRMSYRRAWLLLEDLNVGFDEPVAHASAGGRGGGGVTLTDFGERLVAGYRSLESGLQSLAATHMSEFNSHVKTSRPRHSLRAASIRRKRLAPG